MCATVLLDALRFRHRPAISDRSGVWPDRFGTPLEADRIAARSAALAPRKRRARSVGPRSLLPTAVSSTSCG